MLLGRKTVSVLLVLFLALAQTVYAEEIKVGMVINKVLSTDIKAFVNGHQIPSMNIDGHTVIVAEDLRNYGFDVVWNPGDRSLRITENLLKGLKPVVIDSTGHEETGKILGDVLYTDIKTYVGNREVQSYNIGGYTTLLIREIEEWGNVTWDEDKREVRFISDNLSSLTETENGDNFSFRVDKLSEVQVALENKGTKYYYNGKEAGFHGRAAMLSLKILAQEFGYVCSYDNGYFIVQKGSYSFKMRGNDKKAQNFFDGKLFRERELWPEPTVIDNDLFVSDVDLTELFGLDKVWDIETNNIYLNYPEYDVKDYGNHEILGEVFVLRAVSNSEPYIEIINRTSGSGNNSYGFSHGSYNRERSQFETETRLLNLGYEDNELDAAVTFKGRILLLKSYKNVRPNVKTHEMLNERTIGPWTTVRIESPATGYVETSTGQFKINGEIASVNGDTLTVEIEKLDEYTNQYEKLAPQSLTVKDDEFYGSISLEAGNGIYKVRVFANVTGLHGYTGNTLAFEFFINRLM